MMDTDDDAFGGSWTRTTSSISSIAIRTVSITGSTTRSLNSSPKTALSITDRVSHQPCGQEPVSVGCSGIPKPGLPLPVTTTRISL